MKQRSALGTGNLVTLSDGAEELVELSRPIALLADGATEPPTELRLFAAGVIETTKGLFKCTPASCESVLAAHAELGRDYPFDYEHASVFAAFSPNPAEAGKAAGWFKPLARDGEIWASGIVWTPSAREKIIAREFRYISPTFRASDDGEVQELHSCALTNDPATKRAKPIINARTNAGVNATLAAGEKEKHVMLKLLAARLGLAETATEAEVIAALSRHQDEARISSELVAQILSLTAKPTTGEAMGVIAGWKAGADQVATLSARVNELEKAASARELEQLIATGKADGKLSPALETWARSQGVAALKAFLEVAPKVISAPKQEPQDDSGATALTREEGEVARLLQLDPKKVAAHKAAKTSAA